MKYKIQIESEMVKVTEDNVTTVKGLEMFDDIYWRTNRTIEEVANKNGKCKISINIEITD